MASGEGARDFWRVIAGFFLPPWGVFLQVGLSMAFWINLLMTLTGVLVVPAQLHALWVIANTDERGRSREGGMTTFLALLLGFWLPPIGVAIKIGVGLPLVINLVLTLLGWFPGVVHAAWVVTAED